MISKGIGYILIATLAFAVMNIAAKALTTLHPMQVVFVRAFGTFLFVFPYMLIRGVPILGTHRKMLFLRGLTGVISLSAFFIAIQRIPLGSAISIRYLGPIFGAIMAFYFLKEKINFKQWVSFAIAFTGVAVLKGFDVRIDYLSLSLVLLSAFTVGIVFTLLRYLGNKEHHLTIINYFMVISFSFALIFSHSWNMPVGQEWLWIACLAICGTTGQIFMTIAFQSEETSVLAPFKYMELVYAIILGYLIFDETYQLLPLMGIVLIIGGMALNVYAKKQKKVLKPIN